MESRLLDKNTTTQPNPTQPIPVYLTPTMQESDEISLIDLWQVISKRKIIILVSFFASVLLAFIYLFFAEPVYKSTTFLLPPQQQHIQALLIDDRGIEGINQYTPESVYRAFLDNLKSQGMRREFFDEHQLIKHYMPSDSTHEINDDRVFDGFNKQLTMQVDKVTPSFITVSFNNNNPELAAQWLNQIIDFANQRTIAQLSGNINVTIQSKITQIRNQLNNKLKFSAQRRHDGIVALKEALLIAEALDIKDSGTFTNMMKKTPSELVINTTQIPSYMRGTKALQEEISVLEKRKSDEPFNRKFRDLQEKLAYMESISINTETLSTVTIDAPAHIPYQAEKPRKRLVMIIVAVLGFMIGIFLVFVAEFLSKFYDKHEV
ncbi:hypothetical protein MNBD_GAMMA16-1939 [hydrothermal vent metagenome]|uniref:Polysaccharide chain length determinant N-terminal domain-containing protein n=1 Tax=hydrothermal vent metagenome TaxID=652676 RepID=A0A3B0ZKW0_9ZZZZ